MDHHGHDRSPVGRKFESVPDDVGVEEPDHLAQDVGHVVQVEFDVAGLQAVVEKDVVQDRNVLQDENVRQTHLLVKKKHFKIS